MAQSSVPTETASEPNPAHSPTRRITIDPITRLEGHGKIEIFLDAQGDVLRALYQVTELRGFEAFCVGRPAEDMPQITSRICGVCPVAHHMASTKALDALYDVSPPPAAVRIRELVYHAFMVEDHALHLYLLGGPDLFLGAEHPRESRNALGVFSALGPEMAHRIISVRAALRELITRVGGRAAQPVLGLPGGVAKPVSAEEAGEFARMADDTVDFAAATLQLLKDRVLSSADFRSALASETYTHRTHYLGLVDARNRVQFYDGELRAVDPAGREVARFPAEAYASWIRERVEPWSYAKLCYLRPPGWKGFVDGADSGIYAVGPLARLNVAEGMATPQAQRAFEEYTAALGPRPVHATLATHWARAIEMLYAAERLRELLQDPALVDARIRNLPESAPSTGVGVVEAPRGTLIHDYTTDDDGLIREVNLIVGTQHNAARIALSVEKAAKDTIRNGTVSEGLLNRIEMAFRAYDPCNACASHSLPDGAPFAVAIRDCEGRLVREWSR